ncbi:GyrI-like domain-containing protein [Chitinophaga vietnamensis]|uniref:GyrI-like domain-containing protein n=1 Tax=Chitinophaga vietnamensis TaxID=2593957 RepID=UPI0011776211|nr:GyrI-like domain-containing protein [Chitinophaga vietnamensis]
METVTYTQTSLPLHFFYRRYETDFQGMMALVRVVTKELYEAAIAAGLEVSGPVEWHYRGFDGQPGTRFTLDIGLPVTALQPVPAPYRCETLSPFQFASALHEGPWEELAATYGPLFARIAAMGLEYSGYHREQYFQYDFTNSSQNLTRILLGVTKA